MKQILSKNLVEYGRGYVCVTKQLQTSEVQTSEETKRWMKHDLLQYLANHLPPLGERGEYTITVSAADHCIPLMNVHSLTALICCSPEQQKYLIEEAKKGGQV